MLYTEAVRIFKSIRGNNRITGVFYHGSIVSGIDTLEPRPHKITNNKHVVFASNDRTFAVAMIHGLFDELAFGYITDGGTKIKIIEEVKPNALNVLRKPGYLYTVSSDGFKSYPGLMKEEFISVVPVKTLKEYKIKNVFNDLDSSGVVFIKYDDVPDFRPELNTLYKIQKSSVHGKGIFTKKAIKKNIQVGLGFYKYRNTRITDNNYLRSDLGAYVNHSDHPNIKLFIQGKRTYYKTIVDVPIGSELFVDYSTFPWS